MRWTPEEDALLRELYPQGAAACAAMFPRRTYRSVTLRAFNLKVVCRPTWSRAEDAVIWSNWGTMTRAEIGAKVGRTSVAVAARAKLLGLHIGCPDGYEYLSGAVKRTGYDMPALREILRAANVKITQTEASRVAPRYFVLPSAVDAAVAKWHQTETIESAARRLGLNHNTLREWVTAARRRYGLPKQPARRCHWRIPSDTIEAVVAERRAHETVSAGALRVGVRRRTLVRWLTAAGVERTPGRVWMVRSATVDAVVAARLARPRVLGRPSNAERRAA